jgi:hypothetical protein
LLVLEPGRGTEPPRATLGASGGMGGAFARFNGTF